MLEQVINKAVECSTISILDQVLDRTIEERRLVSKPVEVQKPAVEAPVQEPVKALERQPAIETPKLAIGTFVEYNGARHRISWIGKCKYTGIPRYGLSSGSKRPMLFVNHDQVSALQTTQRPKVSTKRRRICSQCGLPIGNRGPGECDTYTE